MFYSQLLLSGYILTFLTGFPANILAFCTFYRKVRRKTTPIDVLLLNLTISDLIFLVLLPFKMKEAADHMAWVMPYTLCPLTGFLFFVTIYNSTLLLTAVGVERYLGVAYPLRYYLHRRPRYAIMASITFWILTSVNLSMVYIIPYIQWNKGGSSNSSDTNKSAHPPTTCYMDFSEEELDIVVKVRLELFLVLFCVPFLICCFCYVNFIVILSRLPNISRRRRLRAIGLALATLLVFTVCFGPYNASHVVGFIRRESEEWRHVALLSSSLNASLDPIIFYFSSAAVRSMLNRCFRNVVAKLHILRCREAPRGSHQRPSKTEKYNDAPQP